MGASVALTPAQARAFGVMLRRTARQHIVPMTQGRPRGSSGVRVWCTVVQWSVKDESAGKAYRWKYKLQRIALQDDDTINLVPDDTTFGTWPEVYALNEMELSNQPQHTGYQTTGTNQGGDYPDTFFIEPVGGGGDGTPAVRVPCYARRMNKPDGSLVWLFSTANAENGSCPE